MRDGFGLWMDTLTWAGAHHKNPTFNPPSNSPLILPFWRRCSMGRGWISIHPKKPGSSSCMRTMHHRYRLWNDSSRCFRCAQGNLNPADATTTGIEPNRSMPRKRKPPERTSDSAMSSPSSGKSTAFQPHRQRSHRGIRDLSGPGQQHNAQKTLPRSCLDIEQGKAFIFAKEPGLLAGWPSANRLQAPATCPYSFPRGPALRRDQT